MSSTAFTFDEQLVKVSENMKMVLENKIEQVTDFLEQHKTQCFYFSYGRSLLYFLQAGFTFEKQQFEVALKSLKKSLKIIQNNRKHGISKHVYISNYNSFSDEECHAELCYAEALIAYAAAVTLLEPGFTDFINAATKVKISHDCYKLCFKILENKTNWQTELRKVHFESGVRLGIAGFELGCSYLPVFFQKLLIFVGFTGNRDFGIRLLREAEHTRNGVRFYGIHGALLAYNIAAETVFGTKSLGEYDEKLVKHIVDTWTPNGEESIFVAIKAAFNHRNGNIKETIKLYNRCLEIADDSWITVTKGLKLLLVTCYALEGNWNECVKLLQETNDYLRYSPAVTDYALAVCLSMKMDEERDEKYIPSIQKLLRTIPSLKKHFGGLFAFHEKLIIKRSKQYAENVERMILPELFYIWNYFCVLEKSKEYLKLILRKIDQKFETITEESNFEGFMYLTFLKGVVFRHLKIDNKAIQCFENILKNERKIKCENHLQPQSALELASIYKCWDRIDLAKIYTKKAKQFSGYLTESLVKFRLNLLSNSIK
ncbi:tetratricopeptide repeat protein 39B-like protein [Leptotrombidium deliense]|uniref:Tetratricopeptide repeat protein 39B-like protein n=1 Tax=Leptotrombidium deliense TaxID=299467 RepID=A0A443S7Q5_9ACAR|nr:tetratricopeptide repeat protein 39B-like protein [Leptotrombidium deliense]